MNKPRSDLSATEIAQLANAKSQGKRPDYFSDPMAERSFSITMALVAELAVARERIDTLERILIGKGVLTAEEIEDFVPDSQGGKERQLAQVEYSVRIFRSLAQEVEALEGAELSVAEMASRLGEVDPPGDADA